MEEETVLEIAFPRFVLGYLTQAYVLSSICHAALLFIKLGVFLAFNMNPLKTQCQIALPSDDSW